jgi:hypothetical protein
VPNSFQPVALTIDANQNIWAAPYYTNASIAMVLPNLTPAATATYTTSGTTVTPVSATLGGNGIKPLGLVVDASGNAWYGITGTTANSDAGNSPLLTGLDEVIPTLNGSSVITSITPQSSLIASTAFGVWATGIPGIDGAGSVYLGDNFSSTAGTAEGVHVYSTTTSQVLSPPSGYLGCYLATSSTTACGLVGTNTFVSATYNPREVSIDSTGSVWAGITTGGFTQFIGLASPAWPLLATGKPGLSPGNTAVTPLP